MLLPESFTDEEFITTCGSRCSSIEAEVVYLSFRTIEVILPVNITKPPDSKVAKWDWDYFGWSVPKILLNAAVNSTFVQGDTEGWENQRRQSKAIALEGTGPMISRSTVVDWEFVHLSEPSSATSIDFFQVLASRRTKRDFSGSSSVDLDTVSGILHHVARAQTIWEHPQYGPQMLRTSPSGGARHPIEIYPQIINSYDIESGNYLYCPVQHALSKISEVDSDEIYQIGQKQNGCLDGSIAFLITTNYPRNFWKYRYSRSFLFSHYDCGHFVQTLILVLKAYGLDSFLTPAVNIEKCSKYLAIDSYYDETPSYLVVAG